MLAFVHWMLLHLTTKSQLQETWYSADLKLLYIIHLLKMLYSSNLSFCESSGKIFQCTLLLLWQWPSLNLPAWYIQIGGKNIHSSSGPSLRNISHIHKWEILHGEGCPRQPRFLVKCEWHSLWYLTLMPGAVSLSDQWRRLHESSYLYRVEWPGTLC